MLCSLIHRLSQVQDAAVEISRLLRDAKVDAPLRPKALAAILVASVRGKSASPPSANGRQMWDGSRTLRPSQQGRPAKTPALHKGGQMRGASRIWDAREVALADINCQVSAALGDIALPTHVRGELIEALRLAGNDFGGLPAFLPQIEGLLGRIDASEALAGDSDFLGVFYEAFLRYGFDNNALGIVFTPRHITRFCVDLIGVAAGDRAIDIACGTGGFLVAAYEAMRRLRTPGTATERHRDKKIKEETAGQIAGFDTNPTVWALATLNLVFRGPAQETAASGRGAVRCALELGNCFDNANRRKVRRRFTRAFLNPPFSQDAEPERDFLDATMDALVAGGRCAAVVKAGIFADEEHAAWRAQFARRHTLLGVVSLPEDLFYPTAAPTSILLAEAHRPQPETAPVLMARVWNDGFEKLKNKRVPRAGCELSEVKRCFAALVAGGSFQSPIAVTVPGARLMDGNEWSPQEWLPQPGPVTDGPTSAKSFRCAPLSVRRQMWGTEQREVVAAIFRTVAEFPETSDAVLDDFTSPWQHQPPLPQRRSGLLSDFFQVLNGRSAGEKRFDEGNLPYISSGGRTNSVVRLVDGDAGELFAEGGLTVTAFGQAAVQPWPFFARGNGGSAVRVLTPRVRMGMAELVWFAAQINAQQWRFFYARMAIKSRIERLTVTSPGEELPLWGKKSIGARIREFRDKLHELSTPQ